MRSLNHLVADQDVEVIGEVIGVAMKLREHQLDLPAQSSSALHLY